MKFFGLNAFWIFAILWVVLCVVAILDSLWLLVGFSALMVFVSVLLVFKVDYKDNAEV